MHGGWYGPGWPQYVAPAEFAEPGIYPVKVLVWDRDREAGVEVYSDVNPAGEERDVGNGIKLRLLPFLAGPAKNSGREAGPALPTLFVTPRPAMTSARPLLLGIR